MILMMRVMLRALVLVVALGLVPPGWSSAPPSPGFLRVAVVQFRSGEDIGDNTTRMAEQIAAAAARGWPVVIFRRRTRQVVRRSTAGAAAVSLAGAGFAAGYQVARRR